MIPQKNRFLLGAALAATLALPLATQAAYLSVDDSNPATMTITGGDFEDGLFVNGNLLTTGLGSSGSITLPDGGYNLSGSWIDLGQTVPGSVLHLFFSDAGDPTGVTSGLELTGNTDGFFGSVTGTTGGYTGTVYFTTGEPTFPQDGGTQSGSFPYLSVSFTPEGSSVPEASTNLCAGFLAAIAGVTALRRRQRKA